ncbi:MAG: type 1 glutamine amidotransferase [Corynebacterium provencense]|jgi:protease I|uniref:type 1 glutamine amidotransferase domain-containing protein n=1 Tax=Corynebacterium provencense TaxID=1737425 RepID=UPI002989D8BE|nr:type 1 glutamine amidotransferase [Corynebacterium provencense]
MTGVLIISTNYGTETDEIRRPIKAFREADVPVTVASVDGGEIRTVVGDRAEGPVVDSDTTLAEVAASDYDLVVIPGGTVNADTLRTDPDAQRIVRGAASAGIPVAAICHGPWLLVSTDLVVGKTLTSYPSLAVDVTNAGGTWVDEEVSVDPTNGFTLVTSRTPDDLPAFIRAAFEARDARVKDE